MTPYEEIVQRNLAHMGTPARDWQACAVEMVMTEGGPAPDSEIPAGYAPAPSIIPDTPGPGACPCLLCGHPIKNCYWLRNDARRWVLRVGSECVTHFGTAESGEKLAKDAELERARRAIEALRGFATREAMTERGGYFSWNWARRLLGKGTLATPGAQRAWWRSLSRQLDRTVSSMRNNAAKQHPEYALPLTRLANTLSELA